MQTGDALQMLFKGEQIKPKAAPTLKLVHEVAPTREIVERAQRLDRRRRQGAAPWDEKEFKPPSGKVFSPQGMMVWPAANAIYRRETYDNYPAAKAILHAVYEGLQLPMDLALRVEVALVRADPALAGSRGDDPLAVPLDGRIEQGRASARRTSARPNLKKVGILGAGFMGAGIAYVSALTGIDVVLIDRDQESGRQGQGRFDKLISAQV